MKKLFSKEFWAERDMEIFIGKFLRYGVIVSCIITIIGGILYFIQQDGQMPDYSPKTNEEFTGVAAYLRELSTIFPRILALDGAAIIQLGVCVLIATPVLRIVISVFSFLIEKDYMYVAITLIVLFIILLNMIFGLH